MHLGWKLIQGGTERASVCPYRLLASYIGTRNGLTLMCAFIVQVLVFDQPYELC